MNNKLNLLLAIRVVRSPTWIWGVCGALGLFSSATSAQYCPPQTVTQTYKSCSGPDGKVCNFYTVVKYVPSLCSYAQPPTPLPPPPVFKTPAEIEREVHVNYCLSTPGKVSVAIEQCEYNARGYHGGFVAAKCSGVQSADWSFKITLNNTVDVGCSQTITPGSTCREDAANARDLTISRCKLDGGKYLAAVALQCSDVN